VHPGTPLPGTPLPDGPGPPPDDPEEWTDEQWLAWLKATDDLAESPEPSLGTGPRITRSAGGQVLAQAMLGMAQAIFGRQDDEIVIVSEGDAEPEGEQPFTVHLVPDHPERSYVEFRRHSTETD
jgi:hypothetical protein